jgi:hypothetical protein
MMSGRGAGGQTKRRELVGQATESGVQPEDNGSH